MILQVLIAMVAGWLQRYQQQVIAYLLAENRVLKAQLGGRRLRLIDAERRRLAALAHRLDRTRLQEVATPDSLLCRHRRLIPQKFDASYHRRFLDRPRVAEEIEQLVVRMAEEKATWGYRRIQGVLANLGHHIDAIAVRNILRGTSRASRRVAELLSSRGSVTQHIISTIRDIRANLPDT
jgi:hypothetical protein